MMRYLRGTVLLGVSAFLWACNAEPEGTEGGTPDKILADPTAVFVDLGATKTVLVRLVDQQGGALSAPITISNIGTGITVVGDSGFRPVYNSAGELVFNTFNSELRLLVTGTGLNAATFDVEAEGITESVAVTVMPTTMEATVTGVPADITVPVTITAPAGLKFGHDARVTDGTNTVAYIVGFNADSTAINVLPVPGADGEDVTFEGVIPAYSPTLSLTLASTADLSVGAAVGPGFTGVDALATAPELHNIEAGGGILDVGSSFPNDVRYYKMVLQNDALLDVTLTYDGGKDLGVYLFDEAGVEIAALADAHGDDAGTFGGAPSSPESGTENEVPAGTYYVGIVLFDYGPATQTLPTYFDLSIEPHE